MIKGSIQKKIHIDQIIVDTKNPRYNDKLDGTGKSEWKINDILAIMEDDLTDIYESIKIHGVLDPIWVIPKDSRTYSVIEGSRRVTALLKLHKTQTRDSKKYAYVLANVVDQSTKPNEINGLKILLQTGKKKWGPYNVAYVINTLFDSGLNYKEIAKLMAKSKYFIEREYRSFALYNEYVAYLKQSNNIVNPRKYTYFQRAGENINKKFFSTRIGRKKFFKLITPQGTEKARISSVAMKGGLYHFNRIAGDDQILNKFMNNIEFTVDDAMKLFYAKYITEKYGWAKKCIQISKDIESIAPDVIMEIKNGQELKKELKIIQKFCKQILG